MSSRILIVSFSVCPAPDRHGVQLANVLKALAPRYSVDVLTLRAGAMPFQERFGKARMFRVPVVGSMPEKVDAFRRALRRQLEGEEYEVIHLRSAIGARAVLSEPRGRGAKLVYDVARSTEGEPRAADSTLADALAAEEQLCLDRADLILVPTETARDVLITRGLGDRVERVPVGVDVDHFDWEPRTSSDGVPRILFAGTIGGGRGVRTLIAAFRLVCQTRRAKLVFAGAVDEGFEPLFAAALAPLDGGLVERLGAIEHEDLPRLIATATVCVAPAAPEPERPLACFPTKLLEYMACKRAVIAPRRAAVEEVVRHGESGLLFEPASERGLADAIIRLLDDAALRERLAEAGYARARALHAASASRRRLVEAYARLLPPSSWVPPAAAVSPIDALASHPDTTTARRANPLTGEFVVHAAPERPVEEGGIVIEIDAALPGDIDQN